MTFEERNKNYMEQRKSLNYEVAKEIFGTNFFEYPRSYKEVVDSLDSDSLKLCNEAHSVKRLTKEAHILLQEKILEILKSGKNVDAEELLPIKEKLFNDSKPNITFICIDLLAKYDTEIPFTSLYFEGTQALNNAWNCFMQASLAKSLKKISLNKAVFANFNTYSQNWIRFKVAQMIKDERAGLPINDSAEKKAKFIIARLGDYIAKYGRRPTDAQLAKECGLPLSTIEAFRNIINCVSDDGDVKKLQVSIDIMQLDELPGKDRGDALEIKLIKEDYIKQLKKVLSENEFEILNLTYGLTCDAEKNYQIAKKIGVSVYYVSRNLTSALNKIKKNENLLCSLQYIVANQ